MKTNAEEPYKSSENSEAISLGNLALATIMAPLSSICIVIFITSGIQFIAQEQWSGIPILWPPVLYLGGIIGGIIGGLIAFMEIKSVIDQNQVLSPVQLFSSDIFYLSLLLLLTYILELLSENLLLQGLLFFLEIAFFIVIGRNISRKSLEIFTMTDDSENQEIELTSDGNTQ